MKNLFLSKKITKHQSLFLASLGFLSLIFLWAVLSFSGLIKPIFLPTPVAVFNSVIKLTRDFDLLNDIKISVLRIFLGFLLAVIISIPLGIFLGMNKKVEAFGGPIISFIRYIPASALVPLLFFGWA
jgi:NitT/TauT family transport system permease protein